MKWYAYYCDLGLSAVYACGDNRDKPCGDYYAFSSKRARDVWVDKHKWDCNSICMARKITCSEVVSQLGRHFVISNRKEDEFDGAQLCKKD